MVDNNTQDIQLRQRLAELLASGGVGYNSISQEVMYMLPRGFMDAYVSLWEAAMGPVINSVGEQQERDGILGKIDTKTRLKGKMPGAGAGAGNRGGGKGWVVRSEKAFEIKKQVDKKLRAISRDLRQLLEELRDEQEQINVKKVEGRARKLGEELELSSEQREALVRQAVRGAKGGNAGVGGHRGENQGSNRGSDSGLQSHSKSHRCRIGGHIMANAWNFCPIDGSRYRIEDNEENNKEGTSNDI